MMHPVILVAGARPNFMKIAPLYRALAQRNVPLLLVHTGQHYDDNMSQVFFDDLDLPRPDIYLGVGSGTHAEQTGRVMIDFEQICLAQSPSLVVVVGDVNSTVACAMVAAKLWIPCAHVEAGLRSFDRRMPEEINRLVTDCLANFLFTPSPDADENLRAEGVPAERIHFVGNIMIDTLKQQLERARASSILSGLELERGGYAVLTLHRPSNVDDRRVFTRILTALERIAKQTPLIFPAHPRTLKQVDEFGLRQRLEAIPGLLLSAPLGYLDFLALMGGSQLVLTDSGGLQEETTALGIPCLTLRENTERPITIEQGTNTIVGSDTEAIVKAAEEALAGGGKRGRIPELWDGRTADRIAEIIVQAIE